MRLYRLNYENSNGVQTEWHASETKSKSARAALAKSELIGKPTIEPVDVLTNKEGLLTFLNGLAKAA